MFAFVRFRAPDAKAFCQSSACVPEILLRLASVWGEWVNSVGRTVRFLVAKALNFKKYAKIRVRVVSFAFASFMCVNRMHSRQMRKRRERERRGSERRDDSPRQPSSAVFMLLQ